MREGGRSGGERERETHFTDPQASDVARVTAALARAGRLDAQVLTPALPAACLERPEEGEQAGVTIYTRVTAREGKKPSRKNCNAVVGKSFPT